MCAHVFSRLWNNLGNLLSRMARVVVGDNRSLKYHDIFEIIKYYNSWEVFCVTRFLIFQLPRSTRPGHPFVSRRNEYQPKGGDTLRLGSKGRYRSCVGGR